MTKATLFNVIIFGETFEKIACFENFPCQVIVLREGKTINQEQEDKGSCHTIYLTGPLSALPNLFLPHMISDMPVFLLWGKEIFSENGLLKFLKSICDRIVFETTTMNPKTADKILKILKSPHIELVDLNFARLSHWRDLFLRLFDTKEQVKKLMDANAIEIHYSEDPIRATLFKGWLEALCKLTGKITLKKEDSQYVKGDIIEMSIDLKQQESIKIKRVGDGSKITIMHSYKENCSLPYTIPLLDFTKSLTFTKELFYYPIGNHYQYTLQAISQHG